MVYVSTRGVTELLGSEGMLSPKLFVATTVKVYAVPLERPLTVHGEAAHEPVRPSGLLVAV